MFRQSHARRCSRRGRRARGPRRASRWPRSARPQGSTDRDPYATFIGMRGFAALVLALLATSAHADDTAPPPSDPAEGSAPALEPRDEFGPVLLIERIDIIGNTNTHEEIIRRALPIA